MAREVTRYGRKGRHSGLPAGLEFGEEEADGGVVVREGGVTLFEAPPQLISVDPLHLDHLLRLKGEPVEGDLFVQLDEVDVHELPVHLMAGGDVNRVLQPPEVDVAGRGERQPELLVDLLRGRLQSGGPRLDVPGGGDVKAPRVQPLGERPLLQ